MKKHLSLLIITLFLGGCTSTPQYLGLTVQPPAFPEDGVEHTLIDTFSSQYEGIIIDGTVEKGRGIFIVSIGEYKGNWYEGEFLGSKFHGEGKLYSIMEDNYQGEFKDGLRHGQGTYTHPDIKYIGEWKDDKYHGNGTVNTHDGFKYVGEWENGLQNGQGKFTSRDGYKYEGEFKDSKYYGQGTEIFRNGKQYVGDWKDSNPHGKGTETFPDGRKYVGEFKDGLRHGQGTFTGSDRVKYEGEWKGGERNGFGVYTLSKVSKYVGEFDSGIKNGKGVNFPVNGEPQSGIWVEDKFREKWTIEAVSDFLNSKYPQFTGFNIDVPAEVEAVSTVPTPNPAVGTVKSSGSSISGVIAVIDFEGNNISSAEVRALTDRLRSELVTIGQFTIIERGQMDEVLKEQAFQQTGCVSSECAVEVGKLLGVENIITGSISRVGTIYSVSARAFSVASGEIIKTAVYDHSGDIGGLLTQGMRKVAEELGK